MNRIGYVLLRTNNFHKSCKFYNEILGMDQVGLDDRSSNDKNKYITAYFQYSDFVKIAIVLNIDTEFEYNPGDVLSAIEIYINDSNDIVKKLKQFNIDYEERVHYHNGINRRHILFNSPEGIKIIVMEKGYVF